MQGLEFTELWCGRRKGCERQGLRSPRLPQASKWLWTLLKHSAVWWLCLQHWYWIHGGFFGTNPSSLSSWMQSHTNLVLLTNMPRKNARWLQHPCLLLIFREAFQNPSLLNKNTKQLLILEEKKPQINTKYQCYLHKNYLILIPPQHSTSHGCLWEKKANMEHWYFCEMHALIPLPHSSGNLRIVATIFCFIFQS